jgi:hypothetical protein
MKVSNLWCEVSVGSLLNLCDECGHTVAMGSADLERSRKQQITVIYVRGPGVHCKGQNSP